jgi:hypothetical protein
MSWTLRTSLRPSDNPTSLDDVFHTARFGTMVTRDGRAELNLNRPTHEALDVHRMVQFTAVNQLTRETNAPVTVESRGEVDEDGTGSYTIVVTIGD